MNSEIISGIDNLKKVGFHKFENVIDKDLLSPILDEWSDFIKEKRKETSIKSSDEPLLSLFNAREGGKKIIRPLSEFKTIKTLLHSKELKYLASEIANRNKVRLIESIIFSKEPKCNNDVCWHVDESFFPLISRDRIKHWFITFWMPLNKVTEQNGYMEYVGGSHEITQRGSVDLSTGKVIEGDDRPGIDLKGIEEKKYEIFNGISDVGDVLVHYGNTWHRSTPNITQNQRRPAVSFKFILGEIEYHRRKFGNSDRIIFSRSFQNGELFEDQTVPLLV